MAQKWMSGVKVIDLHRTRGNGPFRAGRFLGVTLHVNVARHGTPDSFWKNNRGQVTPNFQVYKGPKLGNADGVGTHQMLPIDWQPWCQIEGNFRYAAIETAGMPDEPLTDFQLAECARICAQYRKDKGMKLVVTDTPGKAGLITHQDGGQAWGGHSCPGRIRSKQRDEIIRLAKRRIRPATPPKPKPLKSTRHGAPKFPLRIGHFFGDIDGPAKSHGGINEKERVGVRAIETRLKALGYYRGPITGVFDRGSTHRLEDAVRDFQRHNKLPVDGDVGRKTWPVLFSSTARKK